MKIDKQQIELKVFDQYAHYYLGDRYIGMIFFKKGEISDHRGIIRKNRLKIDRKNPYKDLRFTLFVLLNHVLEERWFIEGSDLQKVKHNIVKNSENILKKESISIGKRSHD